jgi:hypothetical protein
MVHVNGELGSSAHLYLSRGYLINIFDYQRTGLATQPLEATYQRPMAGRDLKRLSLDGVA